MTEWVSSPEMADRHPEWKDILLLHYVAKLGLIH